MASISDLINGLKESVMETNDSNSPDTPKWKHHTRELLYPLLGVGMYAMPSLLVLNDLQFQPIVMILLLTFGLMVFTLTSAKSGKAIPSRGKPSLDVQDFEQSEAIEILTTEYEQIGEEARYREELLTHSNYFSLATFALLVNIFLSVDTYLEPVVAMGGSIIAFGFVVSVNGLKDSRDQLWTRLKNIETMDEIQRNLSVFHTVDNQGKRRLFNRFSFSSYTLVVQILILLFWILLYNISLLG